ncbi:MAG: hypothetical protein ACLFRG_05275 [Desulfococcaceae bacterium]
MKGAEHVGRRAELLAELFLQELEPEFLAKAPSENFAFDFLIGFLNEEGGFNSFAVEVKATETPVSGEYSVKRNLFRKMANSNIPVLLLVIDVKRNELFFAWPEEGNIAKADRGSVVIPLKKIDETSKMELRLQMSGDESAVEEKASTA